MRIDLMMSEAAGRAGVDMLRSTEVYLRSIDSVLPGPRSLITITGDPSAAIPEVGIGGFSNPDSGDIIVSVDTTAGRDLAGILRDWLPLTLRTSSTTADGSPAGPATAARLAKLW